MSPSPSVPVVLVLRGGVAAGGCALVVAVLASVLLPLGLWTPALVLPLTAAGVAGVLLACRRLPLRPARRVTTAAAWATLAVAGLAGVGAGLTHDQDAVLRRDAGSYAQYAVWIGSHHRLIVDPDLAAFGGSAALADPAFGLGSPAFYQVDRGSGSAASAEIVPQFLPGAPALWSFGWWAAGWPGLTVAPAFVGALAGLAMGGLAARLVGGWYTPLAALLLALCAPVLLTIRSTLSESVGLLLVLTAASLLVDATTSFPGPLERSPTEATRAAARLGVAAGAVLGLTGLVRVDALREVALVLPVAALLRVRRHPAGLPLAASCVVTAGLSLGWAAAFSGPYLSDIGGSLRPLVAGTVLVAVGCGLAVRLASSGWPARVRQLAAGRHGRLPAPLRRPAVVGWAVVAVAAVLLSRPWWLTSRGAPSRFVADLQRSQGLVVDGPRTYAEQSLRWVLWWVGPVTLLLAVGAAAVVATESVRRRPPGAAVPGWLGPGLVAGLSSLAVLLRPGIAPDHPWADRRLVPVLLPAALLAAVAAQAWWADRRPAGRGRAVVTVIALLGALVPMTVATAPLVVHGGTEVGEPAAVAGVCAALDPREAVLAVDGLGRDMWPQVVRGVCGRPAAVVGASGRAEATDVTRVADRVVRSGFQPVLLATDAATLTDLGLVPVHVAHLRTTEEQSRLTSRPSGTQPLIIDVWLASWPAG